MNLNTAFATLRLPLSASPREIQDAFRKLASESHPDTATTPCLLPLHILTQARDKALAYAATAPCPLCNGVGRVAGPPSRRLGVPAWYDLCAPCEGSGLLHVKK